MMSTTHNHFTVSQTRIPNFKARVVSGLRICLMLVAVALMIRMVSNGWFDIVTAVRTLATTKMQFVAAAIACEIAWTFSLAQVYRSALMAMGGSAKRVASLRVSMGAFSLSRILPGGGAVGSVFAARELMALGNSGAITVASMVMSWWISMVTLSVLVMAGTGAAVATGIMSSGYLIAPGLTLFGLLVVGALGVLAVRNPRLRTRALALAERACPDSVNGGGGAEGVFETAVQELKGRRLIVVSMWSGLSWALDAAALWIIFAAFGYPLSAGPLLVGYGAGNLLQALPELTPGWLGVLETTMSVTYSAFGVPSGIAVIAVLAYRVLSYWLPVAAGMPAGIAMLRRGGKKSPVGQFRVEVAS